MPEREDRSGLSGEASESRAVYVRVCVYISGVPDSVSGTKMSWFMEKVVSKNRCARNI